MIRHCGRALLLFALQVVDFALKRTYLSLKVQALRLEILYLRFQLIKLPVEIRHLRSRRDRQGDALRGEVGKDSAHG